MRRIARTFLSLVLVCAGAFPLTPLAFAQQQSYAALSLAADKLNVITHVPVTGSILDRNTKQEYPVSDDAFNVVAARAVAESLKGRGQVALFSAADPKLFALQDRFVDADQLPAELTTAVQELIAQSSATRLILVTKHSGEVSMPLYNGHVGDGKLAGVGFYMDRELKINNIDNGDTSTGFIAPFASMEVSLIDTKTLRTIRHVHASAAKVFPAAVSKTASLPWDILTDAQKVEKLEAVIRSAVREAVPKVVDGD